MVTIYDIAKKAGVSHMTVSRVFNNPDLVNKKTREKIVNISNDIGYRPNQIARSMRTKRTNCIGLILPDIINPVFPAIVRGVEDYAKQNKYNVILVNTDNDYRVESDSLNMFFSRNIDGLIFSGIAGGTKDSTIVNKIIEKEIPVVLIDRYIPNLNVSYVITNNFQAAHDATNYLIRLGHKRIGVISSPQKIKIFKDRLKGYKQALKENKITYNEEFVFEGEETIESGFLTTKRLLKKNTDITAIFTMCDFMAFGAYRYCKQNSIRIPEDISIISIDDIFTSSLVTPPLTTMAQQKYEMGFNAAKILIDSISKNKVPKKKIVLDALLVERDSCKII